MTKAAAKKIIQLPLDRNLLARIDETAEALETSRVAFIHEACRLHLQSLERKSLDRQYVAGYRRVPEETDWANTGSTLLSQILPQEEW